MRVRRRPVLIPPGAPPLFPHPERADEDGLLAIGGDLGPERLLAAYDAGIFPWYDVGLPPMWWSPDPRTILDEQDLHVSRSMHRLLRATAWQVTFDRAFVDVMTACGSRREEGTWIIPEMIDAYEELHQLGHAHSFEVWEKDELVGGVYGVQRGGFFAAESMFHRRSNASKVALIVAVTTLCSQGIELFDVQFLTRHLASLGARQVSRREYLFRLHHARAQTVRLSALSGTPLLELCRRRLG